jgi:hypothetical protein
VPSLTEVAVAVPLNFSPFGEVVTHVIEAPRLATKRGGASERRESKEQPASAVGQAMCLPGADAALTKDNTHQHQPASAKAGAVHAAAEPDSRSAAWGRCSVLRAGTLGRSDRRPRRSLTR